MKRNAETPVEELETEVKNPQADVLAEAPEKPMTNHKTRIAMIVGYNGINFCGS